MYKDSMGWCRFIKDGQKQNVMQWCYEEIGIAMTKILEVVGPFRFR